MTPLRSEGRADHIKQHRFQPGNPGGPGRKPGSRNKLGEVFLKALLDDFEKHGVETIVRVRDEEPASYLKIIAGLMPKVLVGEDEKPLFEGITVQFVRPPKS